MTYDIFVFISLSKMNIKILFEKVLSSMNINLVYSLFVYLLFSMLINSTNF